MVEIIITEHAKKRFKERLNIHNMDQMVKITTCAHKFGIVREDRHDEVGTYLACLALRQENNKDCRIYRGRVFVFNGQTLITILNLDKRIIRILEKEKDKDVDSNTMKVKEISEVLGVSESSIKRAIKKHFPDKMTNGLATLLNEQEVTTIKLEIEKHHNLSTTEQLPHTDLEMAMKLVETAQYFESRFREVKKENEVMKPKAECFDVFLDTKDLHNINEVAKILGSGEKRMFRFLRDNNVLMKDNTPYQYYMERKWFEVKETIRNRRCYKITMVTAKGIMEIERLYNNKKNGYLPFTSEQLSLPN